MYGHIVGCLDYKSLNTKREKNLSRSIPAYMMIWILNNNAVDELYR